VRWKSRMSGAAVAVVALLASVSPAEAQPPPPTPPPVAGEDPFARPLPATEATPGEERWGFSLFVDQDSVYPWLGPWGGDQNYTMGVGLQLTGRIVRPVAWPLRQVDALFGLGRLHGRLARESTALLPGDVPAYFESHSLTLANGGFTPRRLDLAEPIPDDRPYASILSLTAGRSTIDPYGRRVLRTELTLGVLGLNLAKSVQTSIHTKRRRANQRKDPSAVTPYDPAGWPNQISDGGEPTAKYTATWLQALSESTPHDFTLQLEGSLGYYTNAAVGFVGRVGWLRSDFWTVQTNPLAAVNQGLRDQGGGDGSRVPRRDRSRDKPEAYLFGAARVRLVAYNELLQGGFRRSAVELEDTEIERVLRELDAGATLSWKGLSATISLTRRSPEYRVGEPRTHTWGGIYLVYRSQ